MKLSFIDHQRQNYADTVPSTEEGVTDFLIGDYHPDGGVDELGEFVIVLYDLDGNEGLSPQVRVFGDGVPAFTWFMAIGGLNLLHSTPSPKRFSASLLSMGLQDRSDEPLNPKPELEGESA